MPSYVTVDGTIPVTKIVAVAVGPAIKTLFNVSADSAPGLIVKEKL